MSSPAYVTRRARQMYVPRKRLRHDSGGSAVIELALLAPIFLCLLLAVLVMAMYLQNINAMQSAANDTARNIAVAYQRKNQVLAPEIEDIARGVAVQAPYLLDTDKLTVEVEQASASRVTGATEFNLSFSYQLVGLPFVPVDWMTVSYERPIFVI